MTTTTDYFKNFSVFGEKWADLTKSVYEPLTELQKITTSAIERTAKVQIETANDLFTASTEKAKELANIKKFEDFSAFCQNATQEANDKAQAYTKASVDNAIKASTEWTKWVEKGVQHFQQETTKATSKATKK